MNDKITQAIEQVCKQLFDSDVVVALERPDEQFGDVATNVAMQLAGTLGENPRQIAEKIAAGLRETVADMVDEITVAGPGFLNIRLSDQELWKATQHSPLQKYAGQKIVAEYSDPNPFKILHAGHIFTTVIGDAIAKLLELAGAEVHRVNFGGDVGLHVAKTMYIVLQQFDGENPTKLADIPEEKRSEWIADAYVKGHAAYLDDEAAKAAIIELNKCVYQLHADDDHDSPFAQIYWTCRQWSYEAFDVFYERLGTKIEKYYPESETTELGMEAVTKHIGDVFEKSEGAIIFRGEKYGLHNRVFINQQGLPTYETKDVGLILKKYQDYHFDRSVVITGNEQEQYMGVVLKAIEQFLPKLAQATTYIPHGMLKLTGGVKMSSRLGNIVRANDVLDITAEALRESGHKPEDYMLLAAIKYAFLKVRLGRDLVYDPKESVALEGNSGPVILYARARARSILKKAAAAVDTSNNTALEANERSLLRKITEYTEATNKAIEELMPHNICTYLYELAQDFNRFYEHNRVLGDPREAVRLRLVASYADTLQAGLQLLNITASDEI
ncbi:MAG TPA: arginine--tRNA ligase [Nevskiaceae bacterium]|nr:arginine--tRNA ligase [Nevskiaceae bacterium]